MELFNKPKPAPTKEEKLEELQKEIDRLVEEREKLKAQDDSVLKEES